MPDGLAIIENSMLTSMDRMSSISQNIANANTPAYKAQQSFASVIDSLSSSIPGNTLNVVSDTSNGMITQTGKPTDLALYSDGYFVIDMNGDIGLTRNGQFSINQQGELLSVGGYPILGNQGSVRVSEDFSIHTDGTIWEENQQVDALRIVSANPEQLKASGSGLYQLSSGASTSTIEKPVVLQGALEASNVDTRNEMTELIKVMRQIEMQQRIIKAYDQISDTGISTLGEF